MHQITSAQFKAAVELDPAWASKLTEPMEITDYCDMERSQITHLSPLLHFTGKNETGNCAYFKDCKSLKIAEGQFSGSVNFYGSNIEKIGDLSCGKNSDGNSVTFFDCKFLKIAEGSYPGCATFSHSRIEKIKDLTCGKNNNGWSSDFEGCKSLKVAEGKFEGFVSFSWSGIEKIGDLTCGNNKYGIRLSVGNCLKLKSIPGTFNPKEVYANPELMKKLEVDYFIQKKRAKVVEVVI